MPIYEKRCCMTCGKEFVPIRPQIVCCSPECQKIRKRALEKELKRAYRKRIEDTIAQLDSRVKELEEKLKIAETANAQLSMREGAKGNTSKMIQCLRCNVKATQLPCGKNQLCWEPTPCKKCRDMKKPDFKYHRPFDGNHETGGSDDEFFERFKTITE